MYGRVRLQSASDGYTLTLTPTQFELVRRVLLDTYGGGRRPGIVSVAVGEASARVEDLMRREVDFTATESVDLNLSRSDLYVLYRALAFAYLSRSSEEAFHSRFGFFSENVQKLGWAIERALEEVDGSAHEH